MRDKMTVMVGGVVLTREQLVQLLANQNVGSSRRKRSLLPFAKVPKTKWPMPMFYKFVSNQGECELAVVGLVRVSRDGALRALATGGGIPHIDTATNN